MKLTIPLNFTRFARINLSRCSELSLTQHKQNVASLTSENAKLKSTGTTDNNNQSDDLLAVMEEKRQAEATIYQLQSALLAEQTNKQSADAKVASLTAANEEAKNTIKLLEAEIAANGSSR